MSEKGDGGIHAHEVCPQQNQHGEMRDRAFLPLMDFVDLEEISHNEQEDIEKRWATRDEPLTNKGRFVLLIVSFPSGPNNE